LKFSKANKVFADYLLACLATYITAQNLFIITKYPGFDPEVNVASGITAPSLGIDLLRYPSSRSIIFGMNFSL